MNSIEPNYTPGREARLRYMANDLEILVPGEFVRCAVTGALIRLDALRYWSVARQEPYVDAAASLKRHLEGVNSAE